MVDERIVINMDEMFNSQDKASYISMRDELFEIVELNIDNRRKPVEIIVDGETSTVTVGNALTLLICYRIFIETKCKFSKDFLFDPSKINNINGFFDDVLDYTLFNLEEEDFQMVKEIITVIISDLANLSGTINTNYGNTINIKSLIDLAKKVPEFDDLLHMTLPDENLQFDEVEAFIKKSLDRTIEILKENENCLNVYLNSGSGINLKQLGQVINIVGSKPDLDGTIIPYPINTSFIRGLDLPSYFINAKGARKALITNSTQVKSSGYLNRKATLACLDTHSISKVKACGTKHPVPIDIFSEGVLKRYNGRYYLGEDGKDHLITPNKKELIGQTINVYSPLTCSCEDGICERCYGKLSRFNKDINIGIVAVLILMEQLTQRLTK